MPLSHLSTEPCHCKQKESILQRLTESNESLQVIYTNQYNTHFKANM